VRLVKSLLGKGLEESPPDAYHAQRKHMLEKKGLVNVQGDVVQARLGPLNPNADLATKSIDSFVLVTRAMAAA
jgi:hypothetical protein